MVPRCGTEKLGINVYNVHVFEFDSVCRRHANQVKSTIINESYVFLLMLVSKMH